MLAGTPKWKVLALFLGLSILIPVTIVNSNIISPAGQRAASAALTCDNISLGVTASGWYRNNMPENTIDNSLSTRWSNSASGSWIRYDLGQEKVICHIDVAWFKGNQRIYNFVISSSIDGITYQDIYTAQSAKNTSFQRYDFPDTSAKYVKITVNGNSANSWAEINEVDIYGYNADVIAPTLAITNPAHGSSIYVGRVTIEGSASDSSGGSGVTSVEVRVDNNPSIVATPIAPNDWSSWKATIDISSEGEHVISAKAIDASNNSAETSSTVLALIDTVLPAVQITTPADGAHVDLTDGVLSISGTAADMESGLRSVEIKLDDGVYNAVEGGSSWTGTLIIKSNGTHVITARATDNAGNVAYSLVNIDVTVYNTGLDNFGIKKIYPTKDGKEWYVAMDDPASDPYFRNLENLQLTKQPDGSWQVFAQNGQVRMEAWSPENQKWLNVEITEYAKIEKTTLSLLQMYTRGGHHTSSDPCLGSAYKARLYGDGRAAFTKEVTHPAYAGNRGVVDVSDKALEGRWVGFKFVIYNFVENGKTFVRLESYIDDDVTDTNGNLVIRNNWKLATVVEDRGGWATNEGDFTANCSPMSVDNTGQFRQRDEILSMPGGTGTQNIAAWRTDDTTWDFKYLSVREIQPPPQ